MYRRMLHTYRQILLSQKKLSYVCTYEGAGKCQFFISSEITFGKIDCTVVPVPEHDKNLMNQKYRNTYFVETIPESIFLQNVMTTFF